MILDGRIALITGATGNLGPAVVRDLAEAGATIVVTGRKLAGLDALRSSFAIADGRWLAVAADLTDPAATQALVEQALQRFGRVGVGSLRSGRAPPQPVRLVPPLMRPARRPWWP